MQLTGVLFYLASAGLVGRGLAAPTDPTFPGNAVNVRSQLDAAPANAQVARDSFDSAQAGTADGEFDLLGEEDGKKPKPIKPIKPVKPVKPIKPTSKPGGNTKTSAKQTSTKATSTKATSTATKTKTTGKSTSTASTTDDETSTTETASTTDDETSTTETASTTDDETSTTETASTTDDETSTTETASTTDDETSTTETASTTDDETSTTETASTTDDETTTTETASTTDDVETSATETASSTTGTDKPSGSQTGTQTEFTIFPDEDLEWENDEKPKWESQPKSDDTIEKRKKRDVEAGDFAVGKPNDRLMAIGVKNGIVVSAYDRRSGKKIMAHITGFNDINNTNYRDQWEDFAHVVNRFERKPKLSIRMPIPEHFMYSMSDKAFAGQLKMQAKVEKWASKLVGGNNIKWEPIRLSTGWVYMEADGRVFVDEDE